MTVHRRWLWPLAKHFFLVAQVRFPGQARLRNAVVSLQVKLHILKV